MATRPPPLPDIKGNTCWPEIELMISNGEMDAAIARCKTSPCRSEAKCQRFLGWTHYSRDEADEAIYWFSKGCEKGDGDSCYGMGCAAFVKHDFARALSSFEAAIEHGNMRAYLWAGYIYHQGLGVPQDIDRAVKNYRIAAGAGYLIADRALIHLAFQRGQLLAKIRAIPRYVYIIIKAAIIAYRNVDDERIADIPNAFHKRS